MKYLLERFSEFEPNDVVFIADQIGEVRASSLIDVLSSISPLDWHGKNVAIGKLNAAEFVCALVFLDGLANSIVLLPAEEDAQAREIRLAQASVDIVIEGNGLGFAKLLTNRNYAMGNSIGKVSDINRPAPIQTKWLLPTSGTTGTPKLIAHTFSSLTRSMKVRRLGGDYIWGSLYSLRRFAGLQVFLQSWMCITPLILNEEDQDLQRTLRRLIENRCNSLSATPSMWRKLTMHPLFDRLYLKQITLGGEIVDQTILNALAKKFPEARISHIYASTEAGVGFVVCDGHAGFPADYLKSPTSGLEMRIDEQGHLWFKNKVSKSAINSDEPEWIDSGDVVELKDNRVFFLGRANGSINVGGNKVMPEEIESVIKELTDVAFVQVRARKSGVMGNLVEAAITPALGKSMNLEFKKMVISHCRDRLEGFKVPAFIVAADNVELTSSGKLSRKVPK